MKPALVSERPLQLHKQLGREARRKADPTVGEDVTGDLDAGVYRVRHGQVSLGKVIV